MDIFGSEENLDRWYADHEHERALTERPGDTMSTHTPGPLLHCRECAIVPSTEGQTYDLYMLVVS